MGFSLVRGRQDEFRTAWLFPDRGGRVFEFESLVCSKGRTDVSARFGAAEKVRNSGFAVCSRPTREKITPPLRGSGFPRGKPDRSRAVYAKADAVGGHATEKLPPPTRLRASPLPRRLPLKGGVNVKFFSVERDLHRGRTPSFSTVPCQGDKGGWFQGERSGVRAKVAFPLKAMSPEEGFLNNPVFLWIPARAGMTEGGFVISLCRDRSRPVPTGVSFRCELSQPAPLPPPLPEPASASATSPSLSRPSVAAVGKPFSSQPLMP